MAALKAKDDIGKRPRYEVVDKDGNVLGRKFDTAFAAGLFASQFWPDQEQDEDRTGRGWAIQETT